MELARTEPNEPEKQPKFYMEACFYPQFFYHICSTPPQYDISMKSLTFFLSWVCACTVAIAQETPYYTVKAEQGDGIFSLLRKEGLDPMTHYGEFLELNAELLHGGSFLKVGKEYRIPGSGDTFKNTGVVVKTPMGLEEPLFDRELAQMSLRSDQLKDAVYYIIDEQETRLENNFVRDLIKRLAADLMVHGARVYVMGDGDLDPNTGPRPKGPQRLGDYIDAVNRRYLQNSGKYQRVLVIRTRDLDESLPMEVTLQHDHKNGMGQRLAVNIQKAFRENSVGTISTKDPDMVFQDRNSLYLSNNILPPLSLLTLENSSRKSNEKIVLSPNRERFAQWIGNGIMRDYAELEIEE